ncbi:hypothetical protein BDV95DRAFT_601651 [Massariosphaeria phaeospora]|uniref:Uncharacterized protein n=1 Tax=Massariosphaeria phaeospora TaxID=100035 RepID=A0A7C8IDZ3_9PLEO|nr:hypothetical protein BDV95DRAFT_601651 [Massariosphaeria phaeospora]
MSSLATWQPPVTASSANTRPRQKVFRLEEIPVEWEKQSVVALLEQAFPGHKLRVDSLCKAAAGSGSTALVTFDSPVPKGLAELEEGSQEVVTVDVQDCSIIFGNCLGLTTLFEPSAGQQTKADILFVHGLGGHAIGSWTASNGRCWPRDMLGNDVENTRIISFGYEASLTQDTSTSRLSDFGEQLLGQLGILRDSAQDRNRPLFLIGHSFGGTIITWALHNLSSKRKENGFGDTLQAIRCVTFFGTPHTGMSVEELQPLTNGRIHSAASRTLEDLRQNSQILDILREGLQNLNTDIEFNIKFITCVEQKLTTIPSTDGKIPKQYHAVPKSAARLFCHSENTISIHADHRNMIKFSHKGDRHYNQVVQQLRRALEGCASRSVVNRNVRLLSKEQKRELLTSLRYPEMALREKGINEACPGTSEWVFQSPKYVDWFSSSSESNVSGQILWLKGNSGSGKSTLMKSALTHNRTAHGNHSVLGFFFDSQGKSLEKSAMGMYRSLLFQMLESSEDVPCEVEALTPWLKDKRLEWKMFHLKQLLEYFMTHSPQPRTCFIDGLDECQRSDTQEILSFFEQLVHKRTEKDIRLSVCFSSDYDARFSSPHQQVICLEKEAAHTQDILKYAERTLKIGHAAGPVQQQLQQKASGSFLWAVLAVKILDQEPDRHHRHVLRERLQELPSELPELYQYILTNQRGTNSQDMLLRCLESLLRHPQGFSTAKELYFVLFGSSLVKEEDIQRCIATASRGLVQIGHGPMPTVRFVHSSIPDFLHNDKRMSRIWKDYRSASKGDSHEQLKRDCLDLLQGSRNAPNMISDALQSNLENSKGFVDEHINVADGGDQTPRRGATHQLASSFGLPPSQTEFAIKHVLHHANEAQKNGISQEKFLQDFPLDRYTQLEKKSLPSSKTSHQPMNASKPSLLYTLAEKNTPELIAIHPDRSVYMRPGQGPHGSPLFVALVNKNLDTLRVFFELASPTSQIERLPRNRMQTEPSSAHFLDQRSNPQRYEELRESYIQTIQELHEEVVHVISSMDHRTLSDHSAMISAVTKPGNEVLHLFLLLVGELPLQEEPGKSSLFTWSAKKGRVKFLEAFFREGKVDPNGEAGATALRLAAEEGRPQVIAVLRDAGMIHFGQKNQHGQTALDVAVAKGHSEVARLLRYNGAADSEVKHKSSRTSLVSAVTPMSRKAVPIRTQRGHTHALPGVEGGRDQPFAFLNGNAAPIRTQIDHPPPVKTDRDWTHTFVSGHAEAFRTQFDHRNVRPGINGSRHLTEPSLVIGGRNANVPHSMLQTRADSDTRLMVDRRTVTMSQYEEESRAQEWPWQTNGSQWVEESASNDERSSEDFEGRLGEDRSVVEDFEGPLSGDDSASEDNWFVDERNVELEQEDVSQDRDEESEQEDVPQDMDEESEQEDVWQDRDGQLDGQEDYPDVESQDIQDMSYPQYQSNGWENAEDVDEKDDADDDDAGCFSGCCGDGDADGCFSGCFGNNDSNEEDTGCFSCCLGNNDSSGEDADGEDGCFSGCCIQ